jgi:hypothetical protein
MISVSYSPSGPFGEETNLKTDTLVSKQFFGADWFSAAQSFICNVKMTTAISRIVTPCSLVTTYRVWFLVLSYVSVSLPLSCLISHRSYTQTSLSNLGCVFSIWFSNLHFILHTKVHKFLSCVALLPVSSFLAAVSSFMFSHLFFRGFSLFCLQLSALGFSTI